ncbi:hypothetical protein KPL78_06490 [Roseomonas sp. HJA6]|uniref:Resolvase n=1 Tax=Roseomonas alba TaxID=2846776 RepID=A0ABS7A5A3_9PROT|nr:hypothetical protein [Neoroseomonas alba]MBW6397486.1 hypothetical protein [Neoroseomonas alba]
MTSPADRLAAARAARIKQAEDRAARLARFIAECQKIGIEDCASLARVANAEGLRAPRGGHWTSTSMAKATARLPGGRRRLTRAEHVAAMVEGRRAKARLTSTETAVSLIQAARRVRRAGEAMTAAAIAVEAGVSKTTATRHMAAIRRAVL